MKINGKMHYLLRAVDHEGERCAAELPLTRVLVAVRRIAGPAHARRVLFAAMELATASVVEVVLT
jgi:transposase-like protein